MVELVLLIKGREAREWDDAIRELENLISIAFPFVDVAWKCSPWRIVTNKPLSPEHNFLVSPNLSQTIAQLENEALRPKSRNCKTLQNRKKQKSVYIAPTIRAISTKAKLRGLIVSRLRAGRKGLPRISGGRWTVLRSQVRDMTLMGWAPSWMENSLSRDYVRKFWLDSKAGISRYCKAENAIASLDGYRTETSYGCVVPVFTCLCFTPRSLFAASFAHRSSCFQQFRVASATPTATPIANSSLYHPLCEVLSDTKIASFTPLRLFFVGVIHLKSQAPIFYSGSQPCVFLSLNSEMSQPSE